MLFLELINSGWFIHLPIYLFGGFQIHNNIIVEFLQVMDDVGHLFSVELVNVAVHSLDILESWAVRRERSNTSIGMIKISDA